MYEKLFEPVQINGMTVPNRLVFEPMGNYYAELDGKASQRDCDFYAARGAGGIGLVITEICSVNRVHGRGDARNLLLDNDEAIPSFRKMAEAVQATGAKFAVEIYHPGCQGVPELSEGGMLVSPSGQMSKLLNAPTRALEHDEVLGIIEDFVSAGVRVWQSGADAVELHAAHGYLLCQFLSPYTNHRDDEFGGSLEGRAEIMRRIIIGIRERTAPDFPIIVRLTADEYLRMVGIDDGMTLDLAVEYCKLFEQWGADAIDVSAGNYETMNWAWEPVGFDEGWKSVNGKTIDGGLRAPVLRRSRVGQQGEVRSRRRHPSVHQLHALHREPHGRARGSLLPHGVLRERRGRPRVRAAAAGEGRPGPRRRHRRFRPRRPRGRTRAGAPRLQARCAGEGPRARRPAAACRASAQEVAPQVAARVVRGAA